MDFDDRNDSSRQYGAMSMEQTLTTPLNDTIGFYVIAIIDKIKSSKFLFLQGAGNDLGQTTLNYEQILDEASRECKLSLSLILLNFVFLPLYITISICYIVIRIIKTYQDKQNVKHSSCVS